ncbi:MAG: hypothetical protein QOF49_2396 [Chloroflexota bacterium]|jgi:hypothetical protein|nr:hypothetical protein [Chloroflexota bacterium]
MHDQALEQKLRAALRAEGDALPLAISIAELERRDALRRRGGLSPVATVGLAAAVGIALLGLIGVAGGWFETRTAVVLPVPSSPPTAGIAPSSEPSPSPVTLLSLDEILAPLDPGSIVRAQAMGPADGPAPDVAGSQARSIGVAFAPVATAGAYRVWSACLGQDDLEVIVVHPDASEAQPRIPITCDGSMTQRQLGLAAGDAVSLGAGGATSWRVVLQAPDRAPLRAPSIADILVPTEDATLLDVRGETAVPEYGAAGTGGGMWLPSDVGSVAHRDRYRVFVSCAGPRSIRYAFERAADPANRAALAENESVTEVECDGATHLDELDLPLDEALLSVTASDQIAWHIVVTGDALPIGAAADEDGWVTTAGFGPNYAETGGASSVSLPGGEGDASPARVVVGCFGATTITGAIDVGRNAGLGEHPDPFTLDCNAEHGTPLTIARTYPKASGQVHISYDPDGAPVWLVFTVQVRASASAAP